MKKVRAAIVGYGNIGHYVLEALQAAPDFEIAGVVRRAGAENKPEELANYAVVKDIKELEGVEVAILCTPTRSVEKYAKEYLAMGINTVDSFDIHTGIVDLRRTLDAIDCAELNEGERAGRCREMAHREMAALRRAVDALEMQLPQNFWPVPDYSALLYDL